MAGDPAQMRRPRQGSATLDRRGCLGSVTHPRTLGWGPCRGAMSRCQGYRPLYAHIPAPGERRGVGRRTQLPCPGSSPLLGQPSASGRLVPGTRSEAGEEALPVFGPVVPQLWWASMRDSLWEGGALWARAGELPGCAKNTGHAADRCPSGARATLSQADGLGTPPRCACEVGATEAWS